MCTEGIIPYRFHVDHKKRYRLLLSLKAQGQMPTNKWSDTLDVSGTSAQEVSVWEPLSKGRTPGYFLFSNVFSPVSLAYYYYCFHSLQDVMAQCRKGLLGKKVRTGQRRELWPSLSV